MTEGDWTLPALKEYFEGLRQADKEAVALALTAQEKLVTAALASADKATLKAEAASSDRFAASNEIRGAMADAQKGFASVDLAEGLKARLEKAEGELADRRSKSGVAPQIIAYIIAGGSFLVMLVTTIIPMLSK